MPTSLTEHVRQQAKARMPRVKVVRKAAVNPARMHTASLDFDRLSQPSQHSRSEMAQAASLKGTTAAFQLSWPPPAPMAAGVGPTAGTSVVLRDNTAVDQLQREEGLQRSGDHRRYLQVDPRLSQEYLGGALCLSPAVQGDTAHISSAHNSIDQLNMTVDGELCMGPVVCDSPALALAQRPRAQFAQGVPHDSATSLVRLDVRLLPSPFSKQVVQAVPCKAEHALSKVDDACESHDTPMCTPFRMDDQADAVVRNAHDQTGLGTQVVPMIISPDEHYHMQSQAKHCEEEFILYSAPLIDSPGSDSAAESLGAVSPESPAERSILPNSAPGFIITPSPVPFHGVMHDGHNIAAQHTAASAEVVGVGYTPIHDPAPGVLEVDDVEGLNLLLKKWCRLGSDPKDAEEFVDKACKDGRIMPNAATVNNLNKLWDAHEQLHG
ncbi:MAG: hypothetical protein FRX49_09632 [Trebouxia sp. A1-2]|nr:MAG: hypothetical protein FRX49_09632 [Trebouxia sp. A1-2]